MKFEVTILGSNSALPTPKRFSSSQVLNFREKLFLLDCGEGTQIQLRRYNQKFSGINHIFITHLHGDHCFGLPGLISSFNLLGRKAKLHLYAHADLEKVLTPVLAYFMPKASFEIVYHPINPKKNELIYEDRALEVYTIPLKHRMPTCGFLFKEKKNEYNIKKNAIGTFNLGIKDILKIKKGEDHTDSDGKVIPNSRLATPPKPSRSYAYITDTIYKPNIIPMIQNVGTLYHEATYADDAALRISKTMHSTGGQAAQIAQGANAKQLLIGHFSARYNDITIIEKEAKKHFFNTKAIKDGMTISIEAEK